MASVSFEGEAIMKRPAKNVRDWGVECGVTV